MILDREYATPEPLHGTAHIKLGHGEWTIVDADKEDLLNKYLWYSTKQGYAVTNIKKEDGTWKTGVRMHRMILQTDMLVDHINGDTLDNRITNLRPCTDKQNAYNAKKQDRSVYKGVFNERKPTPGQINTWYAHIQVDKIQKHLGSFQTGEQAAKAYDVAAIKHFGEFAKTNFERIT